MAIKDNISVDEMRQEIDLAEIYGREPTPQEASEFAELARGLVIDRTQNGNKRGGGKFQSYSPEYAEFKGSSEVDLTLFGDMLNSVEARPDGSKVELFIDDDLNTKKGYNHHVGDTLPERPWFGLTENEAYGIAKQVERVVETPNLLETIGFASQFQENDIAEILTTIGLFNGEG